MDIPLGKPTTYSDQLDAGLLAPMSRAEARRALGVGTTLPFRGGDVWNGYEFSWLNARGRPEVAGLRLIIDAGSPGFIESKSLKLYLNSYAQSRFPNQDAVRARLQQDLSAGFGETIAVMLMATTALPAANDALPGVSLDGLDIDIDVYSRDPDCLAVSRDAGVSVEETLHTHLFRSLCPVTGQPDWASVLVRYQGPPIDHARLLRYLVSYRTHPAFHESTIEQIFIDLKARCGCTALAVTGYFQRRGGLDINPTRTDGLWTGAARRLPRQ